MRLLDGDSHPLAIDEINDIIEHREPYFGELLGALIQKRQEALQRGELDAHFQPYLLAGGREAYEIVLCTNRGGITAVYVITRGRLRLLTVVAFDDFMREAISGQALTEAIMRAAERI